MKNYLKYGLLGVLLLIEGVTNAQSVRRSVISSIGTSGNVNGLYISSTTGQPPNAGTITSPTITLRQGFQQPPASNIPEGCLNAPKALFTLDKIEKECGDEYSFTYADKAQPGTTFNWTFGQDAYIPTSDQSSPKGISYSSAGTKIVVLEVKTGTCTFSSSIALRVTRAAFGAYAQGSSVACFADANGNIKLTTLNATLPLTYQWERNVSTGSDANNLKPGAYGFTITDAKGCTYSSRSKVDGPDSIGIASKVQPESCDNASNGAISLSVSGGKSPYVYKWSNGANAKDISNLPSGLYSVTITDAISCNRILDFQVNTYCDGLTFKNLITPNGDGINDLWEIEGIENFPDNQVEIFSRWGARVYFKKNYDNSWGGINNGGGELPAGPYYYVLKLNDNVRTVFSGSVSILR